MAFIQKFLVVAAGLSLAACTNPNSFDNPGNSVDLNTPPVTVDPNAVAQNSPAYFSSTIGDRVLFDVDESTLNAAGRALLSKQAIWLLDNSGYSVTIEGHADEQGTREYNLALGARRASAVQQFLISQGVAPNRLKTVTFGKERPLEICSEEACYAKNRRAVSVLAGGIS